MASIGRNKRRVPNIAPLRVTGDAAMHDRFPADGEHRALQGIWE